MELTSLKYFIAVAKIESITRAAEKLNITQSALSKVISKLEGEVGTPLFDRYHKKIRLNEAGHRFLVSVESAFNEISDGITSANSVINRSGQSVISVASTFPSLLNIISERYFIERGGIRLYSSVYTYETAFDKLIAGELDFFLTFEPNVKDERTVWVPLLDEPVFAVVNKNSPFTKSSFNKLSDIKNTPIILSDANYDQYRLIISACQFSGFYPNIIYSGDGIDNISGFLQHDLGILLLPCGECRRLSKALPVRFVPFPDGVCIRHIGIIQRSKPAISDESTRFYDYIQKYLSEYDEMNNCFEDSLK